MQSKFITIRLQCELVEPNYKYKDFAIFFVIFELFKCVLGNLSVWVVNVSCTLALCVPPLLLLWDINHLRICKWNRRLSNDIKFFQLLIVFLNCQVLPIEKPFVIRGLLKAVIVWEKAPNELRISHMSEMGIPLGLEAQSLRHCLIIDSLCFPK